MTELSDPFAPEAIHWRAQTVTRNGDKALALAYLDARDVMDRLDEVCGPTGWQSSITETASGRVLCKLEIREGDDWIAKTDGAGNTAVEGEKGGISDSLKRAAVQWGIGRYLYDLGNVWAPCESRDNNGRKQFVKWKPEAERVFADALARLTDGKANEKPATITEAQQTEIMDLCRQTGINVQEFLKVGGFKDTRDIPASQFDNARSWILNQAEKKKENA